MNLLKNQEKIHFHRLVLGLIFLLSFLSIIAASCSPANPTKTPTLSPTIDLITPTTTTIPPQPTKEIGIEESPIVIGYISFDSSINYESFAQPMIANLEDQTGYNIDFQVFTDALEAFNQLRTGDIHFIFIKPLTYLAASERDLVDPLLVSNHFGLYNYGFQFLANRDSGFSVFYDSKTNRSTTTALNALRQFEGKKPCWTEPSSLSGTIIPYGILAQNGISFTAPAYLQNPASVIRALYIKGICDFGATYALSGDPRTSSMVINDLPDVLDRIEIIWQSEAIIPNLGLSAAVSVSPVIQNNIKNAFLSLVSSEEGKPIISNALQYDIQDFLPVDDDYYNEIRDIVESAGINPYQHLGY